MMATVAPDRFDEQRLAWIKAHALASITDMQKRRAQILTRQISERKRATAGAGADPADNNVRAPLSIRKPSTPEAVLVLAAAVLAPIGWPLGRLLYRRSLTLIPGELPSYPVAAVLWTGFGLGVLTVATYQPGPTLAALLLAPWLIAQIPATFATAAVYAILDGWLAVGPAGWWPSQPPPVTSSLARRLGVGEPDAPPSDRSTGPVLWGVVGCALGSLWMIAGVLAATVSAV